MPPGHDYSRRVLLHGLVFFVVDVLVRLTLLVAKPDLGSGSFEVLARAAALMSFQQPQPVVQVVLSAQGQHTVESTTTTMPASVDTTTAGSSGQSSSQTTSSNDDAATHVFAPFVRSDENLCMDGRLAPELILLGAPKCATSSLADDLFHMGVHWPLTHWQSIGKSPTFKNGRWNGLCKELNFFNSRGRYEEWSQKGWLRHYPKCSKNDTRRAVSMDATPAYLPNNDLQVAFRMKAIYGSAIARVRFVVLLRNPVGRAYSLYCFFRQRNYSGLHDKLAEDYFSSIFHRGAETEDFFLNSGSYADDLEHFFGEMDPRQFTIVPWLHYLAPERMRPEGVSTEDWMSKHPSVLVHILQDLSIPFDPNSLPRKASKANINTDKAVYPELREAFKPLTRVKFQSYVLGRSPATAVARVIARARILTHGQGPVLYGYEGAAAELRTKRHVTDWLEHGWGEV
eukprot:TRINITY_DN39998_c0_g1_i1.p1 TRINITY_DN39998_c0_g1~~TRINITY_DN39998_c0_g1_i1.p1  ORF type:complete len:455 (+),score=42.51 TRINITY_DN39998_c0_g1_i1:105-1469(+)